MHKNYCIFILFMQIFFSSMAQRPMPKEFIVSKLDSIKEEADLIYNHCMIYRLTKQKLESTIIDYNIIIVGLDTLTVSVVNDDNVKMYEANYLNKDTLLLLNEKMFIAKLNDRERLFFLLKRKLIKEIKQTNYGINYSGNNNIQYVLFPDQEKLKFYVFSDSKIKDSIVLYNSFLFYCDVLGDIKSHKVFRPNKLKVSVNDHLGNPKSGFTIIHDKKDPFIFASDIAIFRLANRPQELKGFGIFSRRNKVQMNYNTIDNKISLRGSPTFNTKQ